MSSDVYASIFSLLIYVPLYITDQYKDAVTDSEVLIIEYTCNLVYEKILINNIKPCRVPSAMCLSQMSQAEE